jgi:hypothetical protein
VPNPVDETNREEAIRRALELFRQKIDGMDFSNGPCPSEEIIPGWAVAVAHSPLQLVDNLPENHCQAFRERKVYHFVELDPEGNLIRAV